MFLITHLTHLFKTITFELRHNINRYDSIYVKYDAYYFYFSIIFRFHVINLV